MGDARLLPETGIIGTPIKRITKTPMARAFASDEDGIRIPLQDMARNHFKPGGAYYAGGYGRTLAGWAKEWVDRNPRQWQAACQEILELMRAAMQCGTNTP